MNTEYYIVPEEVFRVGNNASPRLHMVRGSEVDTTTIGDVTTIIANGRGVSLYSSEELAKTELTGWVWRFSAKTPVPAGLKLVNDRPGHYCVAPAMNMTVERYKDLLEQMAVFAQKVWKKRA